MSCIMSDVKVKGMSKITIDLKSYFGTNLSTYDFNASLSLN
jgi:hypothetical protein